MSASAEIVAFPAAAAGQPDAVAPLFERREILRAELARLPKIDEAGAAHSSVPMILAEAERAEREAFVAIGDLGRREFDALKAWIASGCEGPQPKPDAAERERLSSRLCAAMDARKATEQAAGGHEREATLDGAAQAAWPSGALAGEGEAWR